ncbi:MAG TPA: hypothetical protein VEI45_22650 [Mycobacterium sp.]|uniref:hypothetical protein n=1 Tax=Mycobacterium sp. TaxID=1785 RepID=UPI002D3F3149|nr:hypothetical protein [Mycobacterium sp.]HXY67093.1 hypothetical protein [Mycobacterium sp.]
MSARWRNVFHGVFRVYGDHPLHLLTMAAGFALLGYVVATVKPMTLWNPHNWWQSIAVWFAAAVIAHDLLLFPIYALADRILWARAGRRQVRHLPVAVRNYLRMPALGSGLTLLVFLPGIIRQGAPTYLAATGQTQQPFLGRWLLLTAAMFTTSVIVYLLRLALAGRRSSRVSSSTGDPRGTLPE